MNAANNADPKRAGQLSQPCTQPMFHRVLRARPMVVRDTLADIRRRFANELDEDALGRLELVLAEVMNNVTEHGTALDPAQRGRPAAHGAPVIHLCIVRHKNGLSCALTDDGISLPEGCLLPRSLPDGSIADMPEGGFGWFLIQDLTQELCYYREDTRNFLAFHLPVSDGDDDQDNGAGA